MKWEYGVLHMYYHMAVGVEFILFTPEGTQIRQVFERKSSGIIKVSFNQEEWRFHISSALAALGQEGWEIVTVTGAKEALFFRPEVGHYSIWLKRQISSLEDEAA